MKYSGFVSMFCNNGEAIYEFRNGFFDENGLNAEYKLIHAEYRTTYSNDWVPYIGLFPFRNDNIFNQWFISELRFVF